MGLGFPGHLSIFLAFGFNLLAGIFFFLLARGKGNYQNLARYSYAVFTLATTVAVGYLFYLFFSHNFAFKYVYEYSDSRLPFIYILSGFWGGQEGTYLLWLFLNALFGFIIIRSGGEYKNYAMVIFSLVNFFLLLLLLTLSPFAPLSFYAEDGAGLNPLLQDPWMAVHPPVIFVGYAMAALPMVLALAALITKDYSSWVRRSFPWAAMTSIMLGAGNIMGAYWSYKTLGWGGFWAWDPVENASLIPWFTSLALLHGLIIEKRTGALRKTNLLMSAFVFILVVYGTFLTRSGVLADFSVHSFVDLGANNILVVFLAVFVLLTFAFFIPRIKSIGNTPLSYNFYGREFVLFAGMICLFIFSMIVLFWSSLPITSSIFLKEPRAADIATYNGFALPLAVIFSLLLSVAPFLTYSKFTPDRWKLKLVILLPISVIIGFGLFSFVLHSNLVFAVVVSMVIASMVLYFFKKDFLKFLLPLVVTFILVVLIALGLGVKNYMYLVYFAMAGMLTVANLIVVLKHLPARWKVIGGQLTHFGFGLMLIGILGSSAYSSNEHIILQRGLEKTAFDVNISYRGMDNDIMHPHNKLLLTLDDGSGLENGRAEYYFSQRMNAVMRRPYIKRDFLYDLYLSPEQLQLTGEVNGLKLFKETPEEYKGFSFTFKDYEIGEHSTSNKNMRVGAIVEISDGDTVYTIRPAKQMVSDEGGKPAFEDFPDTFGNNKEYTVFLDMIQADEGSVVLRIPGLTENLPPDQLVLDVSRKPLINLVWIGTTLIVIGGLVAFFRRHRELYS